MAFATTNRSKGQVLADFVITVPLVLIGGGSVLSLVIFLSARCLLDLETYALARARLYGGPLSICQPSSLWGKIQTNSPLKISEKCLGDSTAAGEIKWKDQSLAKSYFDLKKGDFSR